MQQAACSGQRMLATELPIIYQARCEDNWLTGYYRPLLLALPLARWEMGNGFAGCALAGTWARLWCHWGRARGRGSTAWVSSGVNTQHGKMLDKYFRTGQVPLLVILFFFGLLVFITSLCSRHLLPSFLILSSVGIIWALSVARCCSPG